MKLGFACLNSRCPHCGADNSDFFDEDAQEVSTALCVVCHKPSTLYDWFHREPEFVTVEVYPGVYRRCPNPNPEKK